ncbi:MAG: hypothetical protein J5818_04280 [Eggerthellaceae bacterium]|nr:hypothetical protein [Eggerthellaceae bacterium]
MSQEKFAERMRITEQAIRHEEADRIPIWCQYGSTPFVLSDGAVTYKDSMYDFDKAGEAIIKFHQDFQPDAQLANMISGRVEEIAETAVLDWPGRPGTKVPDESIYQVLEPELMMEDEYDELLGDFTGFLLHKYIPRAFPGLSGLSKVLNPAPTGYMYFNQMANSLFSPDAIEAYEKLIEIAKINAECQAAIKKVQGTLFGMGFPPLLTGVGMVPYDTLSNYFRHTIDTFEDLMYREENVERAVDMFADLQIKNLQYFHFVDMPVKRVMFWMHKGMDGFMNPEQFEKYYWAPFLKVINALVDMGVTPVIYTEGPYHTRLEQMVGLPAGKCVVHFENIDLQRAKDTVGKDCCITANFPIYLLEHGTVEQVRDEVKRQIDIGAPGGGFIWETNASIQVVKRENLEAMYDTVREYGRK